MSSVTGGRTRRRAPAAPDRDGPYQRRAQELVAQRRRDVAARHRVGGKRRDVRRRQPVVQPADAVVRDRRQEDQDFGQHHEQRR